MASDEQISLGGSSPRPARLVRGAAAQLAAAGLPSPEADARLLVAHVLHTTPLGLLGTPEASPMAIEELGRLIELRASGVPLQHITGTAPFRHLEMAVGPGVFIPRPETETLVEAGLGVLDKSGVPAPIVVDLGTGTGAIAAAVATERPGTTVYAVELDPIALAWAARNLVGTDVRLVAGDLSDCCPELAGTVDLVLSNPPYVPETDRATLPPDVLGHDPERALFAGADGLAVIRDLLPSAARLLRPGGVLIFEHDDAHADSAPELMRGSGAFAQVQSLLDLASRPRFVSGVRR